LNQLNIDKNFKNIFGSYNFRYNQPRKDFIWTFDDFNRVFLNVLSQKKQKNKKEPKKNQKKGK